MAVIGPESRLSRASWWHTVRLLWPYQKQFWLPFGIAVLLLGANLLFDVGMGVVQQSFFAQMHPGHLQQLVRLVWTCGVIGVGLTVLNAVQHYCRSFAQEYANRAFALDVLHKINRTPFEYLQRFHSADLVSRVTNDAGLANNLVSSLVYDVLYQVLLGVVALYYLARINLVTAVVSVLVGPVLFLLGRFFDSRIRRISEDIQARDAAIRSKVQESIQEMTAIRAYGLEQRTVEDFTSAKSAQNRLTVRRSLMQSSMWQLIMLAQGGVQIVSAVLVARSALQGNLSPGQVMSFVFLMGNVQTPFMRMSQVWNGIQQALGAADRVAKISSLPDERTVQDEATSDASLLARGHSTHSLTPHPAIELAHVWFAPGQESSASTSLTSVGSEPSSAGTSLFTDLNLTVHHGETVALVGPSGSGKTSLARLICGLFQAHRGDVRLFGVSMQTHPAEARKFLSYVPQMPYLFSGSIRDNIAFGMDDATDVDVERVAKMASVHDFVAGLEDGYDTVIGEQGYRLSGGQRQRVAIARAFLRDAPILILDEPTSALDNETERTIQNALEHLSHNRTVLVIAHRLSTIRNADRIVVLDGGEIVEQGSHADLLNRDGAYTRMIEFQTS